MLVILVLTLCASVLSTGGSGQLCKVSRATVGRSVCSVSQRLVVKDAVLMRFSSKNGAYRLANVPPNARGYFRLSENRRTLLAARDFDFLKTQMFMLTLSRDSSDDVIDIYIHNRVEESPVRFIKSHWKFSVPENAIPGFKLGRLSAVALMTGNPEIRFRIISSHPEAAVTINSRSGELTTLKIIDREVVSQVKLVIGVYLPEHLRYTNTTCNATIYVTDIDDNPTRWDTLYRTGVLTAASPVGEIVRLKFPMSVQDADSGIQVKFHLKCNCSLGYCDDWFLFRTEPLQIKVAKVLPRNVSVYTLQVVAFQGDRWLLGNTSAVTTILVTVVPDNAAASCGVHLQSRGRLNFRSPLAMLLVASVALNIILFVGMVTYYVREKSTVAQSSPTDGAIALAMASLEDQQQPQEHPQQPRVPSAELPRVPSYIYGSSRYSSVGYAMAGTTSSPPQKKLEEGTRYHTATEVRGAQADCLDSPSDDYLEPCLGHDTVQRQQVSKKASYFEYDDKHKTLPSEK